MRCSVLRPCRMPFVLRACLTSYFVSCLLSLFVCDDFRFLSPSHGSLCLMPLPYVVVLCLTALSLVSCLSLSYIRLSPSCCTALFVVVVVVVVARRASEGGAPARPQGWAPLKPFGRPASTHGTPTTWPGWRSPCTSGESLFYGGRGGGGRREANNNRQREWMIGELVGNR